MFTTIDRRVRLGPGIAAALSALVVALAGCQGLGSGTTAGPAKPLGVGTAATPAELAAFLSPLPDGRGLPEGSGTVAQGKVVYAAQCVACHGDKLQGGIGDKLVGGRGSLVNADRAKAPVKTVESYWPYATTLFDYVKRAMPLDAPGSLSNDEVYAVSAYILAEANVVGRDAVLDRRTLPQVQMPNRDGFVPDHRPEALPPVAASPHSN